MIFLRLSMYTTANMFLLLGFAIILLQSISNVSSAEHKAVDENIYHFDLYFQIVFPNNLANQVAYISFPKKSHLFGTLTVTLTGGYNWQRTHGILRKRFHILYTNNSGLLDQITEITDSAGLLPSQWKIGDLDKKTHRIPIYHLVSTANILTINVEATTIHQNYPKNSITISDPIVVNSPKKP